ncbi:MAG: sigma 54-interacting transcriptional regulator [Proteobacteria bacterium]|nr:sigma 54-interacting transcriptional regulator [Pseudomonadota bacterium]
MGIVRYLCGQLPFPLIRHRFRTWRLRTKLLVALIPSVVIILIITGYITAWFSLRFLNDAVKRSLEIQTVSVAREFEVFLKQCKEDLLIIAEGPIARQALRRHLESRRTISGRPYRELAYISEGESENIFFKAAEGHISYVQAKDVAKISPSPFLLSDSVRELKGGEVWISDIIEVVYPFGEQNRAGTKAATIIRFAAPCYDENNSRAGVLLLSVDAHHLAKIFSQFNSPLSPEFARTVSPGSRYGYFFDKAGWILFHSEKTTGAFQEPPAEPALAEINGAMVKRGGLGYAFRPGSADKNYWKILEQVRGGRHGSIKMIDLGDYGRPSRNPHWHGYAPIRFGVSSEGKPVVFGGVVLCDRSNLTLWAGYKQIDVMFLVTVSTTIIISILIFGLSRIITRPILDLSAVVNHIQKTGKLQEITLPEYDDETSGLQRAINNMIITLKKQMEEIRLKDERIQKESERETARLGEEVNALRKRLESHEIEEIVGFGPVMDSLKANILRAASVDADVLIIGETGSGKQLAAEAIHKHSSRSQGPFISINCGALDENLLLDTLFGHVKGAFTEARGDRKGAFLTAEGGTLFLDEIGTASPRVQLALLRAISMRNIKRLGSDAEIHVNVRLITATNVELSKLIKQGLFREDLYYRLEVITIHTPSLRNHKENIPVLVKDFLNQAGRLMNKEDVGITKGALEKMKNYHWPGNIRELMNCVTRAVAMVDGKLIHVDDIELGGEEPVRFPEKTVAEDGSQAVRPSEPPAHVSDAMIPLDLNTRQKKAFPFILQKKEITRSEYQDVVGNSLPSRTALYDLSDLVKRGFLKKTGRGPATRYYLAKLPDSAE